MQYFSEIISFLIGAGVGFTLKVVIDMRKSTKSENISTTQIGNSAGGSIAGRDVKSGRR